MRNSLPFLLRHARVFFGFLRHHLQNVFNHGGGVFAYRHLNEQFVPEPLTGSGEIEVMSGDGVAIDEGDLTARGIAGASRASSLQQNGAQQTNFYDFSANSVDLDPIANADAIAAHEDEPATEAKNEAL